MRHSAHLLALALVTSAISIPCSAARSKDSGAVVGSGTDPIQITIQSPKGGWTVNRMVKVQGSVSDSTVNPVTISINGDRYLIRTTNGNFSRKFPVTAGKNVLSVQAANKAGTFRVAKTFFAKVNSVPLLAVLTSDTDNVYTDLHIYEPAANLTNPVEQSKSGSEHVFWAHTQSKTGGNFYLNEQAGSYDQPGYGPYLYTHKSPPLGIYRVDANYWPSGDKAHVVATMNVVLFGGTSKEVRKTIRNPLVMPGETLTMAFVRIDKNQVGYIYSPTADPKPKDNSIWPQWVLDFKPRKASGGSEW